MERQRSLQWPVAWRGGGVWHVRSKGSDACLSTLWTHLTVRVSRQSELATLPTAVSWWMIKYENMAQMTKTAIKENNTRVVLRIFYSHKRTLAGVKKVMRGQGSGRYWRYPLLTRCTSINPVLWVFRGAIQQQTSDQVGPFSADATEAFSSTQRPRTGDIFSSGTLVCRPWRWCDVMKIPVDQQSDQPVWRQLRCSIKNQRSPLFSLTLTLNFSKSRLTHRHA